MVFYELILIYMNFCQKEKTELAVFPFCFFMRFSLFYNFVRSKVVFLNASRFFFKVSSVEIIIKNKYSNL